MNQTAFTFEAAKAQGQIAMNRVAENSGPDFQYLAYQFCAQFFREKRRASSEDATDACLANGIRPADLRAFGAVYQRLQREKVIAFAGNCLRRKGHGTSGGRVYEALQ